MKPFWLQRHLTQQWGLRVCIAPVAYLLLLMMLIGGCTDDRDAVRAIQKRRQKRLQSRSIQDHIGETYQLIEDLVELNPREARKQISHHLNEWSKERSAKQNTRNWDTPELLKTIDDLLTPKDIRNRIQLSRFTTNDTDHLRDSYLSKKVVEWVDHSRFDDPLLASWFKKLESDVGDAHADQLRTASRLFDWCVRNISYEPQEAPLPVRGVRFPAESQVTFMKAGYRQTSHQTLFRGSGDSLQLSQVFTLLCRQAQVDAFTLAIADSDSGERTPWAIGVLVDDRIYLFEPELGVPIPGPEQEGIATLAEARKDASVMRRLNVAGFFDYPLSKKDIQQSIALLHVVPEAMSGRMRRLQGALTGDHRMITFVEVDALAKTIDDVRGIADVRLSRIPLLAERYAFELARASDTAPQLQFWHLSTWAILESNIQSSKQLALGRWRHLQGEFSNREEERFQGARRLYLTQRSPEFEIAKLQTDVELQKAYGIRRELGMDPRIYNQLVIKAQEMMRSGKRTATYWIGLLQYDDGRYETAQSWLTQRVIDDSQDSRWDSAAVYNAARTAEKLGNDERAIELYKSEKNSRPHGSRIRARLLTKHKGDIAH